MYEGDFSFGFCMFMMLFDCVLYGVLAWYLDKVRVTLRVRLGM